MQEKVNEINRKIDEAGKMKAWLILLGTAVCSLLFVLIPFFIRGTYTVWTESAGDAATQGVTFLKHVQNYGWLKAIGSYDFYMGMGADYLTSLSFFSLFDPFNLVFFVLPFSDLLSYSITMALKQIACAVTMFAYLRYKKVGNFKGIVLSIAYMLTGFTAMTFVRHYNLTAGPIYLPLIVMGIEKIFEKKPPYLLIFSTFLSLLTNFYVFFSLSVFAVAYAVVFYFYDAGRKGERKSVGSFFKKLVPVGAFYLLGILLAGFMLLPNAVGYLNAARSQSKGFVFFGFDLFFTQLLSYGFPVAGKSYSAMFVHLPLAVLGLYAFFKRNENTKPYAWFTVVLTIGYLLPVFGFLMNILNYSNNRWSYGLSFFLFVLIGLQSKEEEREEKKDEGYDEETVTKINRTVLLYFALLTATALPALGVVIGYSVGLVLACVLVAGLTAFGVYAWIKSGKKIKWIRKLYRSSLLYAAAFCMTVGCCAVYYAVYSTQHDGRTCYSSLFTEEEKYISTLNEREYFRSDFYTGDDWYKSYSNRGVNNRYYSLRSYNSISNKYVYEFFKENGVYNPPQNLGIAGLDERLALQSLLSVRYTYSPYGQFGFEKVDGYENLYQNQAFAPFGFMTEKTYSKDYYLSQSVLDRQLLLLNGVVLEDGVGNADGTYTSVLSTQKVKGENGAYLLKKGETLRFSTDGDCSGQEVYIVVKGVGEVDQATFIEVREGERKKQYYYCAKGNLMYSDQRDFYLNFGVLDGVRTFEISLSQGEEISFDSVEIVCVPTASVSQGVQTLSQSVAWPDMQKTSNSLSDKITAEKDGYFFLSLPYSDGWKAFVDGKETKVLRADTAFMAIALTSGEHEIKFEYETPFLSLGVKVSALTGVGLLAFAVADTLFRLKKRSKEE